MVRLWHRLERLWYHRRWVRLVVLGLVLGTAVPAGQLVIVMITQGLLFDFAQHQKGNFERQTGAYLDRLSAAVLPALVRRDARELFDALDRAQGDRYAGVELRCAIVELPNGTFLASSNPRGFLVNQALHQLLRLGFSGGDGLEGRPDIDRAWLARTLRAEGFPAGRLFAEVDIADSLRVRREILLTWGVVTGCLPLAWLLAGCFVLKWMLRKDIDLFYFIGRAFDRPIQFFGKLGAGFLVLSVAIFGCALVLKDADISLPLAGAIGNAGVLFLLLGIYAAIGRSEVLFGIIIAPLKGMVLEGSRHRTAGSIAELGMWIVIGLLILSISSLSSISFLPAHPFSSTNVRALPYGQC
jgi:hypothetical protein